MDFAGDPPKPKSFTSLLFGIKEKRKPKQPVQTTPPPPPLEPGLKTLTTPINLNRSLSCKKPNIRSFSTSSSSLSLSSSFLPSPLSSSSPSSYSSMDESQDHDKKEREVSSHVVANANGSDSVEGSDGASCRRLRKGRSFKEVREYPPMIPLLARTGNLPCHMPWVLKRSYTDNGRLVIQEVMVKHHEYFRAHRANGRLTLQIMHLDDESATSLLLRSRSPTPNDLTTQKEHAAKEKEEGNAAEKEKVAEETTKGAECEIGISLSSSSSSSSSILKKTDDENAHLQAPISSSSSSSSSIRSMSPPSMLSKELKSMLNLNSVQENFGKWDTKNMREVMEVGTLPSILSSSTPESSFGIGAGGKNGGGCFVNKRSNSLFQMPIPTIRPVHS